MQLGGSSMLLASLFLLTSALCSQPKTEVNNKCDINLAKISVGEKADVMRQVEKEDSADSLWVNLEHLNNTGPRQLIVYDGCTSQNCTVWIFALHGNHATMILPGGDAHDGEYSVLKTIHHGMLDIDLEGFSGGAAEYQTFYRHYEFDGKHYALNNCRSSSTNDQGTKWDGPPHPCQD